MKKCKQKHGTNLVCRAFYLLLITPRLTLKIWLIIINAYQKHWKKYNRIIKFDQNLDNAPLKGNIFHFIKFSGKCADTFSFYNNIILVSSRGPSIQKTIGKHFYIVTFSLYNISKIPTEFTGKSVHCLKEFDDKPTKRKYKLASWLTKRRTGGLKRYISLLHRVAFKSATVPKLYLWIWRFLMNRYSIDRFLIWKKEYLFARFFLEVVCFIH